MSYLQRVINCIAVENERTNFLFQEDPSFYPGKQKIPREDIVKIYELTYKSQMLKQEEKLGDYGIPGQLSDKPYMELSKIEGELERLLDSTLDLMLRTYESHDYVQFDKPDIPPKSDLARRYSDALEEELSTWLQHATIKDIFDLLGKEQVIKDILEMDYVWYTWREFRDEGHEKDVINTFDSLSEKKKRKIIQELVYYPSFINYVKKETKRRLPELREWHKKNSPAWRIWTMYHKLKDEIPSADLSKKIVLFQEALTTMHTEGQMSEYFIQGKNPVSFLKSLSSESNPYKPKWDQDLTKLLGHPPGSTIAPKDVWIQPASKRLGRVIQILGIFYEC